MRHPLLLLPAFTLLSACGDGGGGTGSETGPIGFGLANNRQTAEAGAAFAEPVVGKVVRQRTAAGWRLQIITPAYADTATSGAAVPGAELCMRATAQAINAGLRADAECHITDDKGVAKFKFRGGTLTGTFVFRGCVIPPGGTGAQCALGDSAVLSVVGKTPTAASVKPGDVVGYGTSGNDSTRITLPPGLFVASDNSPAAYRVAPASPSWLRAGSDTVGAQTARQLFLTRAVVVGDTTSVRFFNGAAKEIATARVRVDVKFPDGGGVILGFTYITVTP